MIDRNRWIAKAAQLYQMTADLLTPNVWAVRTGDTTVGYVEYDPARRYESVRLPDCQMSEADDIHPTYHTNAVAAVRALA